MVRHARRAARHNAIREGLTDHAEDRAARDA